MNEGALLVLEESAGQSPQRWVLRDSGTTIGRDKECDIVLPSREVSRRHAALRRHGDRYAVVDLGSKNGTVVNGTPIQGAAVLSDGDVISIAPRYRLRFVDQEATVPSSRRRPGISIDPEGRCVSVDEIVLSPPLSPNQYTLLALLASRPGHVFSRHEIADACYPEAAGGVSDLAIDGLVRRLRSRLAEADPNTDLIVAVRGHGFRLASAGRAAGGTLKGCAPVL